MMVGTRVWGFGGENNRLEGMNLTEVMPLCYTVVTRCICRIYEQILHTTGDCCITEPPLPFSSAKDPYSFRYS